MTVEEFIKTTTVELKHAGIDTARLDTLVLLEDALHRDRAILLAHLEDEIPTPILAELYKKRVAREKHTPLAYIRGKAMFYGRDFIVNNNVLIPRPETESIIDLLKELTPDKPHIVDIGTGSGCIGITAKLEIPENVELHHVKVTSKEADLLPIDESYDVVLANLPYVPDQMEINQAATYEPRLALFSGVDGMDHYKAFWEQLSKITTKPKLIITESLPSQHHMNALLARKSGYYLTALRDFAQAFQPLN